LFLLSCLLLFALSCARTDRELILASTTSTQDSGLFDELIPAFEDAHPDIAVKVIAVGTGEALALGRRRDADVLLVHSPADELVFMRAGHGARRLAVMYNDYVIVGPAEDPAGIKGSQSAVEALGRIVGSGGAFVSRGDSSGTHRKELTLWRQGIEQGHVNDIPERTEVGQGMGETLGIASERRAYTLTDRGTFLSLSPTLNLQVLFEGDPVLRNDYSVITVTGAGADADAFADWLVSDGLAVVRTFGIERFGRPLFTPADSVNH
jgi:tungstate transport system substrate-binding protein